MADTPDRHPGGVAHAAGVIHHPDRMMAFAAQSVPLTRSRSNV